MPKKWYARKLIREKLKLPPKPKRKKYAVRQKGRQMQYFLNIRLRAEGIRKVLDSKAAGYLSLVQGCNGDAKAVATLLMTEKIEHIVQLQVEAIRNIKIDKITVWGPGRWR